MQNLTPLRTIWEQALQAFPYPDLQSAGNLAGDLDKPSPGYIYKEEFTFTAGCIVREIVIAKGWLQVFQHDNGELSIRALFDLTRDCDWETDPLFVGEAGIDAWYDLGRKKWEISIDVWVC